MHNVEGASFRDPSGFVFQKDSQIFRQVNKCYFENYKMLLGSGLYQKLIDCNFLVRHEEISRSESNLIIRPEMIPYISYPYEWCFSQLKEAALLTLNIQKTALSFGMTLKDASAYNVQFVKNRPIFIDTLSFEKYEDKKPWVAYRQFCQHFLAPLVLMSQKDVRFSQLFRIYIDGIPLDLTSSLLPFKSKFNIGILFHVILHAKMQNKYNLKKTENTKTKYMSKNSFEAIIENLSSTIKKLTWNPAGTEWGDYYQNTNYSSVSFSEKLKIVKEFIEITAPKIVFDMGANDGTFSKLADKADLVVAFDIDPAAVEQNYINSQKNSNNILPLCMDLSNPSPALGWCCGERESFFERKRADTVIALALIHHLAISNNVPFAKIAEFFSLLGEWLIIEFVPKSDSQVQRLLSSRKDIFDNYTQDEFENVFQKIYVICEKRVLPESLRTVYLMRKNKA